MEVELTGKGLANWVVVVDYVYQYLAIVRSAGPQRWIFDELQALAKLNYGKLYPRVRLRGHRECEGSGADRIALWAFFLARASPP